MAITIREISGKRGLKKFARFNIDLYKNNPYAVPQLIFDEVGTLSKDKNPAFDYCESVYYMAYDNTKPSAVLQESLIIKLMRKLERKQRGLASSISSIVKKSVKPFSTP